MTATYFRRPLVPEDLPRNGNRVRSRAASQLLAKAATAVLYSTLKKQPLNEVVAKHYPGEKSMVIRAATEPARSDTSGWAMDLVGAEVGADVTVFVPDSAAAPVFAQGKRYTFDGTGTIILPQATAATGTAAFVPQGGAFPVAPFNLDNSIILRPQKLGLIVPFSREIEQYSVPNLQQHLNDRLEIDIEVALDTLLLDDVAGTTVRPPGLRNSIAALTASAATAPFDAMQEDVAALTAAVAPTAGNTGILLIASAAQAQKLRGWRDRPSNTEVVSSGGLTAGTCIALAAAGFVSGGDAQPRVDRASEAMLIMDTAPGADLGEALDLGQNVKALWQTDLVALRVIFQTTWALRTSGALAWTESVVW